MYFYLLVWSKKEGLWFGFFLPLEDLESCIVQLKAKSTWCSRGPQGRFPRAPHQICSLDLCLSHTLRAPLSAASPGLGAVSRGWRTSQRPLQSSLLLAERRDLVSFGEKCPLVLPYLYDLSAYSAADQKERFLCLPIFSASWTYDLRAGGVGTRRISLNHWDLPFTSI